MIFPSQPMHATTGRVLGALAGLALAGTTLLHAASPSKARTEISLNGTWEIAETSNASQPLKFDHTVPVPGLVHSSTPSFSGVDEYQSRELIANLVGQGRLPKADYDALKEGRGLSTQRRQYFWYHRNFIAPQKQAVALLRVGKAQFGIEVYLNGVRIGDHFPCFTSSMFDATNALKWGSTNDLLIRVGADPDRLPANVSQGTDFEKNRWTPGIYDNVSLVLSDNPAITSVQVAPRIGTSEALVETELHNYSSHAVTTKLRQTAAEWKSLREASTKEETEVHLAPGETRRIRQTVVILQEHLWSPDDPFLYVIRTATDGDETTTRFGMREFRFDTPTRRAYLNGKPFFMRGSNITLHRFFEDPDSGQLPWTEAWLQRLLVTIPKSLHWNSFRFCIGPVPERWLEIADESGLLIQNEYLVWTGPNENPFYRAHYDSQEMITEFKEWMRDNWNHPSVAIWDATNESILPEFSNVIIPAVRSLDLSSRPWENGYNAPAGPDDPVEDHQYMFYRRDFNTAEYQNMLGPLPLATTSKSGHAAILNEYGWLWLNRDGSPTLLTEKIYPKLLGKNDTTETRFEMQDYLLQGETEFWRAYRNYAGVLHFVYLTASEPRAFTSDHFISVKDLQLRPGFQKAMEQAFNPLGVYLNFWQPVLKPGPAQSFTVAMVNDEPRERKGILTLTLRNQHGDALANRQIDFLLPSLGAQSYAFALDISDVKGELSLEATAKPADDASVTVTSHRRTAVE